MVMLRCPAPTELGTSDNPVQVRVPQLIPYVASSHVDTGRQILFSNGLSGRFERSQ
jgi:hypothetical protein